MEAKTSRNIFFGQLIFFFFIFVSYLIDPEVLELETIGISYYSNPGLPMLFYVLAFAGCGFFIFRAAKSIPRETKNLNYLKYSLKIILILSVAALLTPYFINKFVDMLHKATIVLLFIFEFILAAWFALRKKTFANIVLVFFLIVGGLLCLLSLLHLIRLMFIGQIIFQGAFGILLIKSSNLLVFSRKRSPLPKNSRSG